jgi:hypothetical protein
MNEIYPQKDTKNAYSATHEKTLLEEDNDIVYISHSVRGTNHIKLQEEISIEGSNITSFVNMVAFSDNSYRKQSGNVKSINLSFQLLASLNFNDSSINITGILF